MKRSNSPNVTTVSIREMKTHMSRLLEQVSSGKLSLKEARNQLSHLLEQIDSGEEIIITRDGNPIARLTPIS